MSERVGSVRLMAEVFWFAILAFLALAIQIAPIGLTPGAWPSPDLMLVLILFYCLHLPHAAPMVLIFALALFRDFVVAGPVGPGVIAILIASEAIKARRGAVLRHRLSYEAPVIALAVFCVLLVEWLFLLVSFARGPALIELGPRFLITVLAYPAVLLILRYVLGLRSHAPVGERGVRAI